MRRLAGGRLLVATHNAGKLAEMRALFAPHGIAVVGAGELGLAAPPETADSLAGNARLKARAALVATGLPTLADDSGLMVDSLNGAPGVHTADWAEAPAGRDYGQAMARVWAALEARDAPEPQRAQFCTVLVLLWPDGTEVVTEGVVRGQLVWPPRGSGGHGYDPIFAPEGQVLTFAEMSAAEKNRLSHRAAAVRRLEASLA